VSQIKMFLAGYLEVPRFGCADNVLDIRGIQLKARQRRGELVFGEMPKRESERETETERETERERQRERGHVADSPIWTAMVCPNFRWCSHNNLHARVGCVILPRSLLAIHVTEAVGVLFEELVVWNNLRKLTFPEHE
jgi:hypothetical protein